MSISLVSSGLLIHNSMSTDLLAGNIAIRGLFDLDHMSQIALYEDLKFKMYDIRTLSPIQLEPNISVPMVVAPGSIKTTEFLRQSTLIKHAPGCENVASYVVIATDYHHFDIPDLFMEMNSIMWKALR